MPKIQRIESIDVVRGILIMIMLFSHVRNTFFWTLEFPDPMPLNFPSGLYWFRTLTDIVHSQFALIAGIAARLYFLTGISRPNLSYYLCVRGLLLIVVDVFVLSNLMDYYLFPYHIHVSVFTIYGVGLIVLAGLIWLPSYGALLLGITMIVGQHLAVNHWHLIDYLIGNRTFADPLLNKFWILAFKPGSFTLYQDITVRVFSPFNYLMACMFIGYGLGNIYCATRIKRHRILLFLGICAVMLYVILRVTHSFGSYFPFLMMDDWEMNLRSLLYLSHYIGSFQSLLLSVGTILICLGIMDIYTRFRSNTLLRMVSTLGKGSFVFFILHQALLWAVYYLLAVLLGYQYTYPSRDDPDFTSKAHTILQLKEFWEWGCLFIIFIAMLYPMIAYYVKIKQASSRKWVYYL